MQSQEIGLAECRGRRPFYKKARPRIGFVGPFQQGPESIPLLRARRVVEEAPSDELLTLETQQIHRRSVALDHGS